MGIVVDLNEETAKTLTAASFLNQEDKDKLKTLIEEIERQEDAKQEINETIKSFFEDAKNDGFDVKVMRQVLRLRRKNKAERESDQTVLEVYCHALGM